MHAARSTATLHAGSARWTWGGPHPEPDFLRSRPSVWLRFDSYKMTQPQTTTELEQSFSISKKNMITKIFKVRKRREMLFVQVCFICSVLFLAWCMSVLLTKTGKWLPPVCFGDAVHHYLWGSLSYNVLLIRRYKAAVHTCPFFGTSDVQLFTVVWMERRASLPSEFKWLHKDDWKHRPLFCVYICRLA